MFKKIFNPNEIINYRIDGIDNIYLINEGDRSIGLFALTKNQMIPAQINPQDICFYILEGNVELTMDEKMFNIKTGEMLIIPKSSAYTIKIQENTKILVVKI